MQRGAIFRRRMLLTHRGRSTREKWWHVAFRSRCAEEAGVAGGGAQCAAAPFNTNVLTPEDHDQDNDDDDSADADIHDVLSLY